MSSGSIWSEIVFGIDAEEESYSIGACPLHGRDHWHASRQAGQHGRLIEYCEPCAADAIEQRIDEVRLSLIDKHGFWPAHPTLMDGIAHGANGEVSTPQDRGLVLSPLPLPVDRDEEAIQRAIAEGRAAAAAIKAKVTQRRVEKEAS